jgi:autotransporter-associated beta strand protein
VSGATGAGGLSISGPGTVNLAAKNSFVGGITIAGGTLELGHTGAAGAGKITFDPGKLTFDPGNAPTNEIDGFGLGDEIDVTHFLSATHTYDGVHLSLNGGPGGPVVLDLPGLTLGSFVVADDLINETTVITACYCRGTHILTSDGEVAVEELSVGDRVVTFTGEARPIRWIGRRAYDGRFIAKNRDILPIRIAAGALAAGVPARDLWLSPEHSLCVDAVLVQAKHLVNGATITQAKAVEQVEYFHIELDSHDVVLADGAPAETYVDCDNRLMFENGGEYTRLYPDDARPRWQFCLPRLERDDPELREIRTALLWRAEALGYDVDYDPAPCLFVDGERISPFERRSLVYRFIVPAGSSAVWLASRSAVPAESDPTSRDVRRLGLPVERILFWDGNRMMEAGHDNPALCEGFHADEATHRWTDGFARLPEILIRSFAGAVGVEIQLVSSDLGYRIVPPSADCAAA